MNGLGGTGPQKASFNYFALDKEQYVPGSELKTEAKHISSRKKKKQFQYSLLAKNKRRKLSFCIFPKFIGTPVWLSWQSM